MDKHKIYLVFFHKNMPCVLKLCSVVMIQWIFFFLTDESEKCDLGFVLSLFSG